MPEESIFLNFIKDNLSDGDKELIYQQPQTCLVIYRDLNNICQTIICNILFIEDNIRRTLIYSWFKEDKHTLLSKSLKELVDLKILLTNSAIAEESFRFNKRFQENYKSAMFERKECGPLTEFIMESRFPLKTEEELQEYSSTKWEAILSLVAGCRNIVSAASIIHEIITKAGYVSHNEITKEGFQFILQQRKKQAWKLLICYLTIMNKNTTQVLDLFSHMGICNLDQTYTLHSPTPTQVEVLRHFAEFGFLYLMASTSTGSTATVFQPTRFLIDLVAGQTQQVDSKGYIFITSNDVIFATTSSKLQTAILKMFAHIQDCLPKMVVGRIADDSILGALEKGITADQIIEFLKNNAHPQMNYPTIIPTTIIDKIKMVQLSNNRVQIVPGCLYYSFSDMRQFDSLVQFAEKKRALLWCKRGEKAGMVVNEESHNDVKKYYKKLKKEFNDYN